jgi:hypothetical protein
MMQNQCPLLAESRGSADLLICVREVEAPNSKHQITNKFKIQKAGKFKTATSPRFEEQRPRMREPWVSAAGRV